MIVRRSDVFLFTVLALAIGKAVLTRVLGLGAAEIPLGLIVELVIPVAVLCAVDVLPRRRQPRLTALAYIGVVAVMYLNLLYMREFGQVIDPGTVQAVGQVGAVFDSVVELVRPIDLLYIIDLPLIALWASDLEIYEHPRPDRQRWVVVAGAGALVLAIVQVAIVSRVPSTVDSMAVARQRGLAAYQVLSLLRRDSEAHAASEPELLSVSSEAGTVASPGALVQQRIASLRTPETPDRLGSIVSGAYEGKHVIVIQVEALQSLAYGVYFNSQKITPNLNRMVEDSWVCTNAYSQSGVGNTSDSEFTANTSLLQPAGKAAVIEYTNRELPSIPRLLGAEGYRTITMHGNDVAFWNRKELYSALGFEKYYDREEFGSTDRMYRGVSDEAFFSAAQGFITQELGRQKPLYVNLVTMSSHAPFDYVPYERRPVQVPEELRGNRAADWIGAISYADMALGRFLEWMKATGLYDESIVIVYGDHEAIRESDLEGVDKQIVEGLLGRSYSVADRQKVPIVIHLPGQTEGGVIDSTVGIVDIAPTVADLLGVDMSETPHLGRSVFMTPADPLVITRGHFPAGSVINGSVAFTPELGFEDGSAVRISGGGQATPTAVEKRDYERAQKLSTLCDEWVRSLPIRPDAADPFDAMIPKSVRRQSDQ